MVADERIVHVEIRLAQFFTWMTAAFCLAEFRWAA